MKTLAAVVLLLVGCGTASSGEDPRAAIATAASPVASLTGIGGGETNGRLVIAVIETRDRRVELHAGSRVTVKTNKGAVVAENVSFDELATRDPFLYEVCRSSFAGAGASGSYIDARLDPKPVSDL